MAAKKRVELSLDKKMSLIKDSEKLDSCRKLSALYGVSKSAVSNVIKRKAEYLDAFECNASPDRKRICIRETSYAEVDRIVFEWFQRNRGLNIPISGPLIKEKHLLLLPTSDSLISRHQMAG